MNENESSASNCSQAMQSIGLEPFDIETTIRDTVDSYYALGIIGADD